MKKRELAAAISSVQATVIILLVIVLLGPGRIWALADAVMPIAVVFLLGALAVLCLAGLPLASLYRVFNDQTRRTYILTTLALIAIGLAGLNML